MSPEEAAKVAARRFGRDHDMPCNRPDVLTCALWECQVRNKCQNVPDVLEERAERIYEKLCDAHLSQDKIALIAQAIRQAENDKLEEAARTLRNHSNPMLRVAAVVVTALKKD